MEYNYRIFRIYSQLFSVIYNHLAQMTKIYKSKKAGVMNVYIALL